MMIYFSEVSLEEGFKLAAIEETHQRLVRGREVSNCSGILLFQHLYSQGYSQGLPITCWNCGCTADRFVVDRGQNDRGGRPVMNLYAERIWPPSKKRPFVNREVIMMTRDHIIPKFRGGVDSIENLRPGCSLCNSQRGHDMDAADLAFELANPHLISQHRLEKARKNAEKHERRERERAAAKVKA